MAAAKATPKMRTIWDIRTDKEAANKGIWVKFDNLSAEFGYEVGVRVRLQEDCPEAKAFAAKFFRKQRRNILNPDLLRDFNIDLIGRYLATEWCGFYDESGQLMALNPDNFRRAFMHLPNKYLDTLSEQCSESDNYLEELERDEKNS